MVPSRSKEAERRRGVEQLYLYHTKMAFTNFDRRLQLRRSPASYTASPRVSADHTDLKQPVDPARNLAISLLDKNTLERCSTGRGMLMMSCMSGRASLVLNHWA